MTTPVETRRAMPRLIGGVPTGLALATMALGVIDIASAVTPARAGRLRALTTVVPLSVAHAANAATVVVGLLLVMLGHGLRRRKRRAWRAAVVLLLASTVLHVVKGLDAEEASLTALAAAALVLQQRQFFAAGDPRTRWRAPAAFGGLLLSSFVVGLIVLALQSGRLLGAPSLATQAAHVLWGLIGVAGPVRFTSSSAADFTGDILGALGAIIVVLPVYLVLRPAEPRAVLTREDEQRLRDLIERHGRRDSLAYFALRRDKAAIFSPTGKSAVSYRVLSGVMLASGDPLGDPEAWPGAIRAFADEAARHAWVPAVIGCSERGAEVWVRETGLRALELGDEAIVEVADFSLDGRPMRNVRQMVTRVERAGYVTCVRRVSDLPAQEIDEVRRQASAWRGAEVERGFSMALGRFGDASDRGCVAVTASKDGRLAALLHFVPWGADGLSLELMLRDRAADPGLNELMIVDALRQAGPLGVTRLSLNFTVFRSALERGGRLGAGPVLRLWRELLLFASRWFQIESLYRFNAKFRPLWEPRFLCYPNARDVPRVAVAALEAEAFLVSPRQWWGHRRLRASDAV